MICVEARNTLGAARVSLFVYCLAVRLQQRGNAQTRYGRGDQAFGAASFARRSAGKAASKCGSGLVTQITTLTKAGVRMADIDGSLVKGQSVGRGDSGE